MKGCIIAFAMYSKIPMPQVEWNEKNMKYSISFFPLIGVVIGGLLWGWYEIVSVLSLSQEMFALVGTVLPVFVTGGIHLDGFMDTVDARSSYQSREKKLEILKDPHIGAFAGIGLVCYMLLFAGAMMEIREMEQVLLLGGSFVLSRIFSGMGVVWIQGAKKSGTLYTFASNSHSKAVRGIFFGELVLGTGALLWAGGLKGLLLVGAAALVYGYYVHMAKKEFGGTTGDLAGFFLSLCELISVLLIGIGGHL